MSGGRYGLVNVSGNARPAVSLGYTITESQIPSSSNLYYCLTGASLDTKNPKVMRKVF